VTLLIWTSCQTLCEIYVGFGWVTSAVSC